MKLSPSLSKRIKQETRAIRVAELDRISTEFSLPAFAEAYLEVHPSKRESIELSHKKWLSIAEQWLLNHNDFKLSYQFIDGHPAFWHYSVNSNNEIDFDSMKMERSEETTAYPPLEFLEKVELNYEKCANFGVFCKTMFTSKNGNVFDLECGQAIHPALLSSYHNYSLDSNGDSFEDAYVGVAFNLYENFGLQLSDDPASGYKFG